jgi:hypothetical protein
MICCHKCLWIHMLHYAASPCPPIFTSPLFPPFQFCPCDWLRPSVQIEQLQNCCLVCLLKFRFCGVRLGIDVHSSAGWIAEFHLEGGNIHVIKQKIFTCYYIVLPIFVLSTPELLKKLLFFSMSSKILWNWIFVIITVLLKITVYLIPNLSQINPVRTI